MDRQATAGTVNPDSVTHNKKSNSTVITTGIKAETIKVAASFAPVRGDMSDIKNAEITSLPNVQNPSQFETISLLRTLNYIKKGKYKELIEAAQIDFLCGNDAGYKAKKLKLPAFCFQGTFKDRVSNDNFIQSSGIVSLDIDKLNPEQMIAVRQFFIDCPHTIFIFTSVSGVGLKAGFKVNPNLITDDKSFKVAYYQIEAYLVKQGITIDHACKDSRRLSFAGDDPDLFFSNNAVPFPLTSVTPDFVEEDGAYPLAHKTKTKSATTTPTLVDNESRCI